MAKHDIIIISVDPWENYTWRRRHHVAWNLAKNNRVLFVEPPLTILQPFRDINLNWRHLLNIGRLKYQGMNLYSYSPFRFLPLSLPGSERFNYYEKDKQRIVKNIKKIILKLQFSNPILWVYFSILQYDYYDLFGEKIRVTDWYDKFTAFSGIGLSASQAISIKNREESLIKNSDVIFAVSEELRNDFTKKNVYVVPQGVDYESFENNQNKNISIQKYLKKIRRPILAFIGIMHFIVDFELLTYVAEQRPDWSILLLGRKWLNNETDKHLFDNLILKENVYYLGEKTKEELPYYLSLANICLMPMKKIELNRCAAPLKLWEYLAAGMPILAVDQGVRYDCHEFIKVTDTKEDFVEAIAEALEEERENGESLAKARNNIARKNSWESRVNQMMEIIESHLNDLN